MSAVAAAWRQTLVRAAHLGARKPAAAVENSITAVVDQGPVSLLVHQLFLFGNTLRRRVLFVAVGREANVSGICEDVGKALSEVSGRTVALVNSRTETDAGSWPKKRPRTVVSERSPLLSKVPIAERVWRIPSSCLMQPWSKDGQGHPDFSEFPFDYLLGACTIGDNETPLLCSACQAAVLVITANHTHRDSALRASEFLRQCNIELLGTVLEGRCFPIPESIYRRL